jgi:phosphate-selective porin OprO/OprP
MGWGTLLDQRIEYAVGTFNTQRNSYQPFNNRQDVMAFLNFKPFYNREEGFLLRDLQVGGSVDAGDEDQPTVPAVLRTNSAPSAAGVNSSGAANSATLPFLAFNQNVRERGARALWELHAAYYRGGLSLIGAWDGGYESYAIGPSGRPNRIPIGGWFAQAGYIVTGETLRDRTLIEPLRPFDLRPGRFGLGAFEITARSSLLDLDRRVFTDGLADPNLWTNRAEMTDVGFNWYLNKFVKVYFDWEHAMFAQPVLFRPGGRQKTSDLFWCAGSRSTSDPGRLDLSTPEVRSRHGRTTTGAEPRSGYAPGHRACPMSAKRTMPRPVSPLALASLARARPRMGVNPRRGSVPIRHPKKR